VLLEEGLGGSEYVDTPVDASIGGIISIPPRNIPIPLIAEKINNIFRLMLL